MIHKITEALATSALAAALAFLIAITAGLVSARAHGDAQWIQDQALRSRTGDLCCGPADCEAIDPADVAVTASGYLIKSRRETIPFGETLPASIDGRLWVCRRFDGSRRCVFDRPPGS
jgi:hypothetical protein